MDELEYRRLLKALPHAIEPDRDLFPGIAARLDARPARRALPARPLFPFAAAAGFVAVAIASGWFALQQLPHAESEPLAAQTPLVLREARAMHAEYEAALVAGTGDRWSALREQADPRYVAAWTELDAAEAELNQALAADPGARFLLDRLKQVQSKRLHLTQKALSA